MSKKSSSAARKIIKDHGGDFGSAVRNLHILEDEIKFEKAKKLLKDNDNKIPYHRWYKDEQFNYHAYGLLKGKVSGYFKLESGRYGGKRRMESYYKVHESGFMVVVNVTMCKIGVAQGLTTPHNFHSSNKKEWDAAFKKVMKIFN